VASEIYGVPYELMACLLFKESRFGSDTGDADVAQFTPAGRRVVNNLLSNPSTFQYFDPGNATQISYKSGWEGYWLYLTSDFPSATRVTPDQTNSEDTYAIIAMAAHLRYGYDKARTDLKKPVAAEPNPIVDVAWFASAGIYNLGEAEVLEALKPSQPMSTFIAAVPNPTTRDYLTKAAACVKKIAPIESLDY
ncbi:MAG: hypothetical protein AAB425_00080, partial [Bdellovibrionota bacterium]